MRSSTRAARKHVAPAAQIYCSEWQRQQPREPAARECPRRASKRRDGTQGYWRGKASSKCVEIKLLCPNCLGSSDLSAFRQIPAGIHCAAAAADLEQSVFGIRVPHAHVPDPIQPMPECTTAFAVLQIGCEFSKVEFLRLLDQVCDGHSLRVPHRFEDISHLT